MRYILSPNIALRSWIFVPYAYYVQGVRNAKGLKKKEYELLRQCDGVQELEISPLLLSLEERGLCRSAKNEERLTKWQEERICNNRYFPAMNWMITGKCNYNCRHCFNAADNNRIQSEFSWAEAQKLIEEAEQCGIHAFTITGGEPMLHPQFMDILRDIYAHGMFVEELNTNGAFLTQEILDEMKQIGCVPLMKISFDGVGHHDWLRNCKGSEENALRAIRLCVENGFPVKAQTNVHRFNMHTMLPTAKLLSEMGVPKMRIIRTMEAPRWTQNAGDACLALEEYFEQMLLLLQEYIKTDLHMDLEIWQFADLFPRDGSYRIRPVECGEGAYRDSLPVCRGNRGMAAVAANGNLYPCHQMSGYYDQHGWFRGNVKTDGLQTHLQSGAYLKEVCTTVKDLTAHNEKCAACRWLKYCCGGCRAIAGALTGDMLGSDLSKCLFFEKGYPARIQTVLKDFRNRTPIE